MQITVTCNHFGKAVRHAIVMSITTKVKITFTWTFMNGRRVNIGPCIILQMTIHGKYYFACIPTWNDPIDSWWRHQSETFSALLSLFARNSSVTVEFPSQWAVTRGFKVNGCVNNCEVGDLRRHRTHFYVTVMLFLIWYSRYNQLKKLQGHVIHWIPKRP